MYNIKAYTIRRTKYASQLTASGVANRWNKSNQYVIYAGSSIALSTLEFIVHRANINIENSYQILSLSIAVNDGEEHLIEQKNLPKKWRSIHAYSQLQEIGSNWYKENKSLIMKVPSAVVPQEYNYLINTSNSAFTSRVKIIDREEFVWDSRLFK
ncbi:MAG: RES domain-containing protein [Brumimicrobium sp.]